MPLFKKKEEHHRMATDDNRTQSSQMSASRPRAPSAPAIADSRAPARSGLSRSSHASSPRSILRNSYPAIPPSQHISQQSHAALLLALHSNMSGPQSFSFVPSPSLPSHLAPSPRSSFAVPPSIPGIEGLPPHMSISQVDPRAHSYYAGAFSPYDISPLPSPYGPSRMSVPTPRGSTPSVRPLHIRKAAPFPFPTEAVALHTLARVLRTETKKFRITDFIDLEEGEFAALVETKQEIEAPVDAPAPRRVARACDSRGRRKSMWDGEEEDETVTDCVRDKMEDEGAGASRWKSERTERSEKRRKEREMRLKDLHLFGTHLDDLPDFALAPVIIGGYQHQVPTVVAAAIEELVASRLKQSNFFNSRPDRKQLFDLVTRFDQLVTLRANAPHGHLVAPPSLSQESTQSVYAILVTYLSALPHAIIPRPLVDSLWCWCVSPSVTRAQRSRSVRTGEDDASESENENEASEDEDAPNYADRLRQREREFLDLPSFRVQIRVARHVLLLLSRRQFSLLIYLMTFIRSVLHLAGDSDKEDGDRTSNGVALHDIARAFGGVILGGRDWKRRGSMKRPASGEAPALDGSRDRTSKEHRIMAWLVNHWGRISSAYEADEPTSKKLGEGPRPRAASLPVNGPGTQRPRQASVVNAPARTREDTSHSQGIRSTPKDTRRDDGSAQSDRRPSDSESLSSGTTANSSDWEEIPAASHYNSRPALQSALKAPVEYNNGTREMIGLKADEIDEGDILDYYTGDGRSQPLGSTGVEVGKTNPTVDDDISIYSSGDFPS
ncbi:hypothetical protein BDW22DRAFT_1195631 [Trametopsis cervina]|nr:hypothetical protein BDW22DRAFT_1195631 [Trametopsis cervina]